MKWAHKGYDVVLSNPDYLYFDFPNEVHPAERGYYWATRFNDTRKVFAFARKTCRRTPRPRLTATATPSAGQG